MKKRHTQIHERIMEKPRRTTAEDVRSLRHRKWFIQSGPGEKDFATSETWKIQPQFCVDFRKDACARLQTTHRTTSTV